MAFDVPPVSLVLDPVTLMLDGGAVQAEVLQRRRGQAGGVPLLADDDDPVVVAGDPGQPGVTAGIEAPFQVVALHHGRAGNLAVDGPLGGGPDVDEHPAFGPFAEGFRRRQPQQPGARGGEHLLDRARAQRPGRHHAAAPSVSLSTSPPGVRS